VSLLRGSKIKIVGSKDGENSSMGAAKSNSPPPFLLETEFGRDKKKSWGLFQNKRILRKLGL